MGGDQRPEFVRAERRKGIRALAEKFCFYAATPLIRIDHESEHVIVRWRAMVLVVLAKTEHARIVFCGPSPVSISGEWWESRPSVKIDQFSR